MCVLYKEDNNLSTSRDVKYTYFSLLSTYLLCNNSTLVPIQQLYTHRMIRMTVTNDNIE